MDLDLTGQHVEDQNGACALSRLAHLTSAEDIHVRVRRYQGIFQAESSVLNLH